MSEQVSKNIVIIGAGLVGLTMACSLLRTGLQLVIVDKSIDGNLKHSEYNGREFAVSFFRNRP